MRRGAGRALLAALAVALAAGASWFALVDEGGVTGPAPDSSATSAGGTDTAGGDPPGARAAAAAGAAAPARSSRARAAPASDRPRTESAPAAQPDALPAAATTPRRTVRGRAGTASGEPIRGAIVRVFGPRGVLAYSTVSDDEGGFVAPDVPAETLEVKLEPTVRNGRASLGGRREVRAKDDAPVEFVMAEAGVASGRVVGGDGSVVPHAELQFYAGTTDVVLSQSRADAEGFFTCAVPRDNVTIVLAEAGTGGVSGRRWAIGIATVPAGGADGIEIHCPEGKKVEGRVVDGSGRPLSGVRLRFAVQISKRPTFATSREDGTITCGGMDARFLDVALDPADAERHGLILTPETVQPGAAEPVTFRIREPATARGRVRDGSGAPVADWKITLTATDGGMERLVRTDSEGRFVAQRLAPGRYRVRVTWVPARERERSHIVGEVETGAPAADFTFPETIVR